MKKITLITKIIIGALILLAPCKMFGQDLESSLLWKIEGEGIKPAYIYGTIHILPQSEFQMTEKVKTAFNESEIVVMELDMDDPNLQMEVMQNAAMTDGSTLDQLVSAEEYEKLSEMLKAKSIPIEGMKGMKPFMISSIFIGDLVEGTPASFEGTFLEMATSANKKLKGLETGKEQMQIFEEISYKEQANDLMEFVNDQENMKKLFADMLELYKQEDISGLYDMVADYMDGEDELDIMVTYRNKNWIERIEQHSAENVIFYAVGAGHLGGPEGVLQLLKENNYTVTPILE